MQNAIPDKEFVVSFSFMHRDLCLKISIKYRNIFLKETGGRRGGRGATKYSRRASPNDTWRRRGQK